MCDWTLSDEGDRPAHPTGYALSVLQTWMDRQNCRANNTLGCYLSRNYFLARILIWRALPKGGGAVPRSRRVLSQ